nr:MAG TPA: hypothetical protein [Caudoviricetes sp.]
MIGGFSIGYFQVIFEVTDLGKTYLLLKKNMVTYASNQVTG